MAHDNLVHGAEAIEFRRQVDWLRQTAGMSWGQITRRADLPEIGNAGGARHRITHLMAAYRGLPDPAQLKAIGDLYEEVSKDFEEEIQPQRLREAKDTPGRQRARELNRIIHALRSVYNLPVEEIGVGLGYEDGTQVYEYLKNGALRTSTNRLSEAREFLKRVQDAHVRKLSEEGVEEGDEEESAVESPPSVRTTGTATVSLGGGSPDTWDRIRSDLMEIADRIRRLGDGYTPEETGLPASVAAEIRQVFVAKHDRLIEFIEEELD